MERLVLRWSALCLVGLGLSGCGAGDGVDRSGEPVVLFAAASTTNALDEIRQQFQRQTGIHVSASYAASSTLAQQIAYGAAVDVFVSANTKWADYLDGEGLVDRRRDLLGNRLVVVVPTGSRLHLREPEDLLDKSVRRLALADYTAAPAGIYAKQALSRLGLWKQLRSKVVAGADVRQALSYVETGAAEAGLVYATDAAVSDSVQVALDVPADLTDPILYPIVLLRHGENNAAAESFYGYLCSREAAEVFRKHGFVVQTGRTVGG